MKRTTVHGCAADIAHFEPFVTGGALRAVTGGSNTGYLPYPYARAFHADRPTYVVYSYDTPIAWYGLRGWVVPAVKYSITTTSHQRVVETQLRHITRCATLISEEGVIR